MGRLTLFRHVIVSAVSLVVVLTMAVPASAVGTLDGVILNGFAEVGKWFTDDCDKSGKAAVTGRGLYFPEALGGQQGVDRERDAVYHLLTEVSAVGATANQDSMTADAGVFLGELEVCGWITSLKGTNVPATGNGTERTEGIGAACGASKGHHGRGTATVTSVPLGVTHKVKLYDLGWVSAVGGALPVTGRFQEYEPGSETVKKDKYGEVVALVTALGTPWGLNDPFQAIANCSGAGNKGNGAQVFAINGYFSLLDTVVEPPKSETVTKDETVPGNTKDCKGTGPEAPIGPDWKKRHDNKPGDVTCPKGAKPAG